MCSSRAQEERLKAFNMPAADLILSQVRSVQDVLEVRMSSGSRLEAVANTFHQALCSNADACYS